MTNNKYKELLYKGAVIKEKYLIEEALIKEGMGWFIDSETSDAKLEIQKETLIFNGGTWYNGVWKFGAWRAGDWKYGHWEDGVWFNGIWYNGIWDSGIIFNGTFLQGEFKDGKLRTTNQDGTPTTQDFVDCNLSASIKKV